MLDAYDLYLRALPHAFDNTLADNDEAIRLLSKALVLDPNYAVAHAHIAWCHEQRFFRGGFHPADKAAALKHAQLALSAGPDDPLALSIASFVHANITHEYELAFHTLDRALQMNSNSALAFGFSALLNALAERYDKAVEHAQRALRLSPFDPLNYHPHLALVYLFTKRFDLAVIHSNRAIQANPGFGLLHVILVASHADLGDFNAARAAGEHLMGLSPGFTVSNFLREDFARPQRMDVIANALQKSGLPL